MLYNYYYMYISVAIPFLRRFRVTYVFRLQLLCRILYGSVSIIFQTKEIDRNLQPISNYCNIKVGLSSVLIFSEHNMAGVYKFDVKTCSFFYVTTGIIIKTQEIS